MPFLDQMIFYAGHKASWTGLGFATFTTIVALGESHTDKLLWQNRGIKGSFEEGIAKELHRMNQQSLLALSNNYPRFLVECVSGKDLAEGELIHAHILKSGVQADIFTENNLVNMYAKCGSIANARHVFNKMSERDVVSWNVVIAGYVHHGHVEEALNLFYQMRRAGMHPNSFTFASILKACASLGALKPGEHVHTHIIKAKFESDVFVGSALVDMYGKCGTVEEARRVFDKMPERNLVSWNAIIVAYAQHGNGKESLRLFEQMQRAGTSQNQFTFTTILSACDNLDVLEQGQQIHARILKTGFVSHLFVENALVDMYAKCGSVEKARLVFDKMPERDMVSWTAIIAGYAQNGHGLESQNLFFQMQQAGMKPDHFTFASVLSACASLVILELSKQVHTHIVQTGFESHVAVRSALVTVYAKCGFIEDAHKLFENMPYRDVASWNAMIAAYAHHGHGKEALRLFAQMAQIGMKPDHITFVGVLSACSHGGLVDVGRHYFDSMCQDYGITPRMEHYACMVDIIGRAGRLDEAEDLINKMPFEPDALVWRTLLGSCTNYGNLKVGKHAAQRLLMLEPRDAATYVLLSNLFARFRKWDDVAVVRKSINDGVLKKEAGRSWIEIKNKMHSFVAGDRSHPQMEEIYANLERMTAQIKLAGYVPDTYFVLHNVELEK
eukprot:Gb_16828 [translate_table: standard]